MTDRERVLEALRDGERTTSALVGRTGIPPQRLGRLLASMEKAGLIASRWEGTGLDDVRLWRRA